MTTATEWPDRLGEYEVDPAKIVGKISAQDAAARERKAKQERLPAAVRNAIRDQADRITARELAERADRRRRGADAVRAAIEAAGPAAVELTTAFGPSEPNADQWDQYYRVTFDAAGWGLLPIVVCVTFGPPYQHVHWGVEHARDAKPRMYPSFAEALAAAAQITEGVTF